jgi:HSP20 family protein
MEIQTPQDWQKHLDELAKHYDPERFFIDQLSKPTNEPDIRDQFFAPTLTESTEIPEEGQLAIDVFQDAQNVYVMAPIAGVRPEHLSISLENDILTISGERDKDLSVEENDYLYHECYWGRFSRSLILPLPVDTNRVQASFRNGVLKITLPKAEERKKIAITVKEEF